MAKNKEEKLSSMAESKKEKLLSREEFKKLALKPLEDLAKDGEAKRYLFRTTSGTTGGIQMLVARKRRKSLNVRGFFNGCKRVAGFFGAYNARLGQMGAIFYRSEKTASIFFDYADLKPESFGRILGEFKPDTLSGFPSFIIKCLEIVCDTKVLQGIKSVVMTGEYISPAKQEFLQKKLPNAKLILFYGVGEIGIISAFCPYLPLGQYHPSEAMKVEIINQDEDGIGDIVVSTELSPSVPINRYLFGDIGKFIESKHKCACGNPITFEVLGRRNFDFIKISGALLMQQEFERVMNNLREYVIDFYGTVKEKRSESGFKGEIILDIIPTLKLINQKNSKDFISQNIIKELFVTPTKTIDVLIRDGTFFPLIVHFVSQIPQGYKDVKLKRVYDNK